MSVSVPESQSLKDSQKQARRFVSAQLITTLVVSFFLLGYNWTACYSALAGGLIATLANAWFALKVFGKSGGDSPATLLAVFYVGELYRFLLTGALFMMAFVLIRPVNIAVLLVIYFLVHITPAIVNTFGPVSGNEN